MPNRIDPNSARLELAASVLGEVLDELTLVGGCAAGLLITDPAADRPRVTYDVDFVIEATSYTESKRLDPAMQRAGFAPDSTPGAPLCRWRSADLVVDLMPTDSRVLGFSNRWYRSTVRHRLPHRLPSGRVLHHTDASHFFATKLEAFFDRGSGDACASHDLEDVVRVIDGRSSSEEDVRQSPTDVRRYVAESIARILGTPYFLEGLPSYFEHPI
ncbi:MAG: hypothetical protein EPO68_09455, partial [Planctomycetota bacterium]